MSGRQATARQTAPASKELFVQADALFAESRRLRSRADAVLNGTGGGRAARLALIDDVQTLLAGLRAAQVAVRSALHRTTTTRVAMAAYGRVQKRL